jgi:ABC-type transport system substrate-binding protein
LTLAAFLLTACAATATTEPITTPVRLSTATVLVNTPFPSLTPTLPPQRAPVLRIAVLGEPGTTNVWAIFDETGQDYWTIAPQIDYWPRLYQLAPPSLTPQPAAARGELSPPDCDTVSCMATVNLQPNLRWTDGSPFSAHDVAFTVNTALQFRLGLNWKVAYTPDVLDHAEALDRTTVKFYFKTRPTIANWQYGTLLGPIVNRIYWQPRIAYAVSLLPDEFLLPTILDLEDELANMQAEMDALNLSLNTMLPYSTAYAETSRAINNLQNELNSTYNKLQNNRSEYETKLAAARTNLFEIISDGEPTLGIWKFSSRTENEFENQANLETYSDKPWFDSVRYLNYPSESAAIEALRSADVDILMLPDGLSSNGLSQLGVNPEITLSRNITRSARFLAFNHANPYLADPILHQALACVLDPDALVSELDGNAAPLPGFVLDEFWQNKDFSLPCPGASADARLLEAVRLLKNGGYSWDQEPSANVAGSGIQRPGEFRVPPLTLLTSEQDDLRYRVAQYIAQWVQFLGLTVEVKTRNPDDLLFSVYGAGDYDMALLGWHLSAYPSYLCDWFLPWDANPLAYNGDRIRSACEAWAQSMDLETAKASASEIQSILMSDLPLIPLYSEVRFDAYRNVRYPFSKVIDGLGGLYGAPGLAIPIP